jgi:MEMO1 family protein
MNIPSKCTCLISMQFSQSLHPPLNFSYIRHADPMPLLVPIMVGATRESKEKEYGKLLAPYLENKENLFVISSDFCHWYIPPKRKILTFRGSRFQYTYYNKQNRRLTPSTSRSVYSSPPIFKAIEALDREGMDLIGNGDYDAFAAYIRDTGNTICGR